MWTKIIKYVIFFDNIPLIEFLSKYPLFPLYDITFALLKKCTCQYTIDIWFDKSNVDFFMLLQNNIDTKNLEHIELLLDYSENYKTPDKILKIKNIICSINNVDLLSSLFPIGIKNKCFMLMDLMLDNIYFDPFLHPLYHNYHFIELLNTKRIKFEKLVKYFWTKIILILNIFLIKDIRQIIFNMAIMTNHIIFTIL
jgi:hypothetical protein